MKNRNTPKLFTLLVIVGLCIGLFDTTDAQTNKTFTTGSYIINMGVHAGVKNTDVANQLKAWGCVYDLLKNYSVPVYVIINPSKQKDGADFTYNSIEYKGGTFIIDKKNISSTVASRIAYWVTQGLQGNYTNSNLTLDVTIKYTVAPKWTLDNQNGSIAIPFFTNAGIPSSSYDLVAPSLLGACNDIFVMPHADPTWAIHGNLFNWNLTYKGAIWTGCHAGSALHNTYNPSNISQQMNFLTSKTNTASTGITIPVANGTSFSQNSLQLWGNHANPTLPFTTCTGTVASGTVATPADPVAQFIGVTDAAHNNGSERSYIPAKNQTWLPTTKIITYDATSPNIPGISAGPDVMIAYGRAFGDNNRGWVMMESGHDIDKGSVGDVAAQRAFWNWSFLAAQDKSVDITTINGIPINSIITGSTNYTLTVNYASTAANTGLQFSWDCIQTSNSLPFGSFSPNGNNNAATTIFTPSAVTTPTNIIISVTITDACGRKSFESFPLTVAPAAVSLSGTVWNDANQSAGNSFNNIFSAGETGANANNSLYVYCLDQDGLIIAIDTVNVDGTYTLTNIGANSSNLTLILSSLPGSIGSLPPAAVIQTTGWTNTTPLVRSGISTNTANLISLDWGIFSFPVANNNVFATDVNQALSGSVAGNDVISANPINEWSLVTQPTNGTIIFHADGSFTYTPNTNFEGADTLFYSICDPFTCDTARVVIFVSSAAPVTLLQFHVKRINQQQAQLQFSTTAEINTSHFDIERSTDGRTFGNRIRLAAKGHPETTTFYQTVDWLEASVPIYFYRLKMTDHDGRFAHSAILSLSLNQDDPNEQSMQVFPNPFSSHLNLLIDHNIREMATITLYAMDGRVVKQQQQLLQNGSNLIMIQALLDLQRGPYLLEVKTKDGRKIKKLVKDH